MMYRLLIKLTSFEYKFGMKVILPFCYFRNSKFDCGRTPSEKFATYIYIFRQGFRVGVVCMYYPLAKMLYTTFYIFNIEY